jgi:hypothetical protein
MILENRGHAKRGPRSLVSLSLSLSLSLFRSDTWAHAGMCNTGTCGRRPMTNVQVSHGIAREPIYRLNVPLVPRKSMPTPNKFHLPNASSQGWVHDNTRNLHKSGGAGGDHLGMYIYFFCIYIYIYIYSFFGNVRASLPRVHITGSLR